MGRDIWQICWRLLFWCVIVRVVQQKNVGRSAIQQKLSICSNYSDFAPNFAELFHWYLKRISWIHFQVYFKKRAKNRINRNNWIFIKILKIKKFNFFIKIKFFSVFFFFWHLFSPNVVLLCFSKNFGSIWSNGHNVF